MLHCRRLPVALCSSAALLAAVAACEDAAYDAASAANIDSQYVDSPGAASRPLAIEESDLYRVNENWLFVHSARSGLNVIDVSVPEDPRLVHQLAVSGRAGELYVENDSAFLLVEEASPSCRLGENFRGGLIATTSQLLAVDRVTTAPELSSPVCLPGQIVSSRKIGNFVYVVTTYELLGLTWALSIDVGSPGQPVLHDSAVMEGIGKEIHVTEDAIYIAEVTPELSTKLRYISLDASAGTLLERGNVEVRGEPAGRFHMDAEGGTLRIVTRGRLWEGSNLHVIDFAQPDRPNIVASLTGLAPGEELHAARFEGDRAYVVTYEAVFLHTDPLWVISLSDPRAPHILGHLEIPGWSDYVFPRGQQLVAVGRGDRGNQVAVSLFDVSNPSEPAELSRVHFGNDSATTEANTDFRAATILDRQEGSLVVVPFTNDVWQGDRCLPRHGVQLVELGEASLALRGTTPYHPGAVRRTVNIGDGLYAIGEREVAALDITNLDEPRVVATLDVSSDESTDECVPLAWNAGSAGFRNWEGSEAGMYACRMTPGRSAATRGSFVWALLLLGSGWMRRSVVKRQRSSIERQRPVTQRQRAA